MPATSTQETTTRLATVAGRCSIGAYTTLAHMVRQLEDSAPETLFVRTIEPASTDLGPEQDVRGWDVYSQLELLGAGLYKGARVEVRGPQKGVDFVVSYLSDPKNYDW